MSAEEIDLLLKEQAEAETAAGVEDIDREIELVEQEIDRIEGQFLAAPPHGLDGVAALLRVAVDRMREKTVTDEGSVFYDYGEARLLGLLERASTDLDDVLSSVERRAG
jgi:hypothetical protein